LQTAKPRTDIPIIRPDRVLALDRGEKGVRVDQFLKLAQIGRR